MILKVTYKYKIYGEIEYYKITNDEIMILWIVGIKINETEQDVANTQTKDLEEEKDRVKEERILNFKR